MCNRHYLRWRRYGDALAGGPPRRPAATPEQTCSVQGCAKQPSGRGFCSNHYYRWMRYGDPLAGQPIRKYRTPGAVCAVEGCGSPVRRKEWCGRHHQRWLKHGDPTGGGPDLAQHLPSDCSVEGCGRMSIGNHGYCNRHHIRWHRYGDPLGGGPDRLPAPSVCIVSDCWDPPTSLGMCAMHYYRSRTTGTTDIDVVRVEDAVEWLAAQSAMERDRSDCWPWPFKIEESGYAIVGHRRASHLSLLMDGHPRPEPPGNWALHSCDNPPCVNPAHLRWGTAADNTADALARGRFTYGDRAWSSKWSDEEIKEMLRRIDAGESKRSVASAFDISYGYLIRISKGDARRFVT